MTRKTKVQTVDEKIAEILENAIASQEAQIRRTAVRFTDETDQQYAEKVASRIRNACVGVGSAWDIPGINRICQGQDVDWNGYRINRRRVDGLDNIYVSRSRQESQP